MDAMKGRIAIVTGASSGIGRAAALKFAAAGASVVCADVDVEGGAKTVSQIEQAGGAGVFCATDVSRQDEVQALVRRAVEQYGGLDIAFNNAGTEGVMGPLTQTTSETWDRVIAVNLSSVFFAMHAQIPEMLRRGGGAIVNCASIAGLVGFPSAAAYVASKHGVVGLTKTAALEYAQQGIRVNALCPGVIRTPMITRATGGDPEAEAAFANAEPVGRLGEPDEMADVALWLCSGASSYVTGQAIAADGGWTAQ